ncbi:MAG: hypothetical protein AMXMBFR46_23940 [Acidimicrobiia bacterium]
MLERISPVLFVAVVAGGFVVSSALPATADPASDRLDRLHATRPVAAPSPDSPHDIPALVDFGGAIVIAQEQERATHEWIAAQVALAEAAAIQERAAQSARTAGSAPSGGSAVSTPAYGSCSGDVGCFLECTRAHESDTAGGYGAVSPGGTYRGAYQFQQTTWDAAVAGAGHAEFAGIPADQAPEAVQDAAAAHLYTEVGNRPWGGRC